MAPDGNEPQDHGLLDPAGRKGFLGMTPTSAIALVLALLVAFWVWEKPWAKEGAPSARQAPATVSPLATLSDAQLVWCKANLQTVWNAAELLGLQAAATLDPDEYPPVPGRRWSDMPNYGALQRAIRERNNSSLFPVYTTEGVGSLWNDLKWFRTEDFVRACRAAYEVR